MHGKSHGSWLHGDGDAALFMESRNPAAKFESSPLIVVVCRLPPLLPLKKFCMLSLPRRRVFTACFGLLCRETALSSCS